jgi:molybdopterin synthase catalytic subunit
VANVIEISDQNIDVEALRQGLANPGSGGVCVFEGWVRNRNEGRDVLRLEYEVYAPLAISEGEKVIAEAKQRYPFLQASCVHRSGLLAIGDCAVWVGVSAAHRDEAFKACRYIIDEIKTRLPIWKKEHYVDGDSGWVNCERCANV